MHPAESSHQVLERQRLARIVNRADLALQEELRRRQRAGDRDDLREAVRHVAEPPAEDPDGLAPTVDLDARAIELVLDGRHPTVLLEDLPQVFGHLGQHGLHRCQEPQAAGPQPVRPLEPGDLRDEAVVPQEHVRRPHGVRRDPGGVRDPFEHHALIHPDPHLAEDVLQEDIPLVLGGAAEEGLEDPPAHLRRLGPVGLRDLGECAGDIEDRERLRIQRGLLRPGHRLLERCPADVQRADVGLREDAADDQMDGGSDFVPPEGAEELRQERTLLEALRRRLELPRQIREARERSLIRGRRSHGDSGPSDAAGFKVSPSASEGPRRT